MKHLASTILPAAGIANGTFKEKGVTCATAKRSKANKDEAYPCPKCKKPYDPKENSIYCNMCCGWLHQKCAKVTDEEWEELSNSEDHWFCDTCLAVGYLHIIKALPPSGYFLNNDTKPAYYQIERLSFY